MQTSIQSKAEEIFGNLDSIVDKVNVFHSHAVFFKDKEFTQILTDQPGAPKNKLDLLFFNFLRTRAQCLITSGKIVRDDPYLYNIDFHLNGNGIKDCEFFQYSDEFHRQLYTKPVAILTRTISLNFFQYASVYKDLRFLKFIFTEDQTAQDYFQSQAIHWNIEDQELVKIKIREEYNIQIIGIKEVTIHKVIQYLKEQKTFQPILSEVGESTFRTSYIEIPSDNPVELLYLGIYQGEIEDHQQGTKFASLDEIISQYKLEQKSTIHEQENGKGKWLLTLWTKRTIEDQLTENLESYRQEILDSICI
ncbi:UNKNOWN [Stylonychia lemnae]|uniref:Uncharacterized protein n=1 Tax=Stylonychia lemnae TaxID=5949 RepID=A0A078A035_STYLE|nr:UNKNOWN [Stylonychia lemnae]|eukprot:CDW75546.1 UNKNOWN [Stylonychia lemnae]